MLAINVQSPFLLAPFLYFFFCEGKQVKLKTVFAPGKSKPLLPTMVCCDKLSRKKMAEKINL